MTSWTTRPPGLERRTRRRISRVCSRRCWNMFVTVVAEVRERAGSAAVDVAWKQWASVTPAAAPVEDRPAWTIIDPEALVIASLAFQDSERRFLDLAAG